MEEINNLLTLADKRLIADYYDELTRSYGDRISKEGKERIHKAFIFACKAHVGVKRKSGEPYIIHPIAVATIASEKIGLGATGIIAALLHDVIEDTDYTFNDLCDIFGLEVANIVEGLTKLSNNIPINPDSKQAENFKKILLTLSRDTRVMLIKLSDRLHNMRTLDSMVSEKQQAIASETLQLFAPSAHLLGLHSIKTELENLSLKYLHPEDYEYILQRLHDQKERHDILVNQFIEPVAKSLIRHNHKVKITGRLKSIYSIWNKMKNKDISFDEIFDIMAIRIVFDNYRDISEQGECFEIYSLLTKIYRPKPDRMRDWVTTPKENGYEALHTTVMGPSGNWVEVQIRSERMDEIAEKGFAAHYKYKHSSEDYQSSAFDWLNKTTENINDSNGDANEVVNDFCYHIQNENIQVFSPKGKMYTLSLGASIIDVAYAIHTDLGNQCIGAKVNHYLVSIEYKPSNGDQVEILTSKNQTPKIEWLNYTSTPKARNKIRVALGISDKETNAKGKSIVDDYILQKGLKQTKAAYKALAFHFNLLSKEKLFSKVALDLITKEELIEAINILKPLIDKFKKINKTKTEEINPSKTFIIKEYDDNEKYILSPCCSPIPGDNVVGYLKAKQILSIHRNTCPKVLDLIGKYPKINTEWSEFRKKEYPITIIIDGFDTIGLLHKITGIISDLKNIKIYSLHADAKDNIFTCKISLLVHSTEDLNKLTTQLINLEGVNAIKRI